jgi:hypothetical protein
LLPGRRAEGRTPSAAQDGATLLDDPSDVAGTERCQRVFNQTGVPLTDAQNFVAVVQAITNARRAAFMPGASPPLVRAAIRRILATSAFLTSDG